MKISWINSDDEGNVGILIFDENDKEYIVLYPVGKSEKSRIIRESEKSLPEINDPTVLIAENLFHAGKSETIS